MAAFDAVIGLSVQVNKALRDIERVERAVNKIKDTTLDIKVKQQGIKKIEESATNLTKSLRAASKAANGLSIFVKSFFKSFQTGPVEELVRLLQAANKETEMALNNTAGYVRILKEAAKEQAYITELARRNRVQQQANTDTLGKLETRISRLKRAQVDQVASSSTFEKITERIVNLEERRNVVLRQQEAVTNNIRKAQLDIAEAVERNIRASKASRQGSGFADFSQRAGAQTAIDKSIARARAKRIEQASRALPDVAARPLALPSSKMLNAAERGIKQIRSVTDQLGQKLDYTNQEVANFINGLKTGANEAVKLPTIFDKVAQSLEVINQNFDEATAKAKRLAGGPAGGTGSTTPIQGRTAALRKLAALEQKLITDTANLRAKKDLQSYNTRRRRLKFLAAQEKKAARERAKRAESIALGVGFPLLFGGGAGSVGGSFAGSFVGSGFGGQIAGGAIGQAIDNYVQGLTKLANSLESTTGIIQGLEEAGYKVSAATESVIASYQKAGLEAEAYEIAISEINRVLGPDGASKLSDYRLANKELQGAFEEAKAALDSELLPALTGMIRLVVGLKNAFDALAESPIFKLVKQGIGNVVGSLPGINGLVLGAQTLQKIGAPSGDVVKPEGQRLAEENALEKKLRDQQDILAKQAEEQNKISDAARAENYVLESKIKLAKAGTDITKEAVYLAQKEVIVREYINSLLKAGFNADAKRNAELRKTLALANLDNRRNKAFAQQKSKAPKSKALQLRAQLIESEKKIFDIRLQYSRLVNGERTALEQQNANAYERVTQELKIIDLKEEQALKSNKVAGDESLIRETYDKQRQIIKEKISLQLEQNKVRLRALDIEKEIVTLQGQQANAQLSTRLGREIEDIQFQMANPLGGFKAERQELATAQARRYADEIGEIEKQVKLLNLELGKDPTNEQLPIRIKNLKDQKAIYEEMLPAIAAAEQQQLRFNQQMEALQPITNALAAGIADIFTSLIDGSKSAEEAFVGMLKNMGQQLIQMATEVLAQQAVMMLLRAFSGGGSPTAPLPFFESRTPGLASGGSAMANRPYLVGENGPELFVPQTSGRVVNNTDSQMALERYTYQDNSPAKPPQPIKIEYTSNSIAGEEYITVGQFKQGLAAAAQQGAKSGETRVMSSLRNSRSRRKSLGL